MPFLSPCYNVIFLAAITYGVFMKWWFSAHEEIVCFDVFLSGQPYISTLYNVIF
jgi:hypothetical protein